LYRLLNFEDMVDSVDCGCPHIEKTLLNMKIGLKCLSFTPQPPPTALSRNFKRGERNVLRSTPQ
jgi:hypothetical protein